jgi:hypothetical protein
MAKNKLVIIQDQGDDEAEQVKPLGPKPDYAKNSTSKIKPITDELQPWHKAPRHMVDYDVDDMWDAPTIETAKHREMTDAASEARGEKRANRSRMLKLRYPDDWSRRGGSKRIASLESEAGRPITVKSVQRYISADKKRQHQEPQN